MRRRRKAPPREPAPDNRGAAAGIVVLGAAVADPPRRLSGRQHLGRARRRGERPAVDDLAGPLATARRVLLAFRLLAPSLPALLSGCATVTGMVTGPVVMPVSWFFRSAPERSLPADLIRAPLCLLVIPFGPLNGVLGAEVDWEYFKNGGYHAILERRKDPDGSVWVRRGLPFTAVFDPCAHLMRVPWEPEAGWDASSPTTPGSQALPSALLAPVPPRR